jgi:hypothetical protein
VLLERELPCEASDITECLASFPHPIERLGFEAGTLSQHLFFGLTTEGFDVVCIEARKVNAALSAMNFVPVPGHWGTRTGHTATPHNLARSSYCQIDVNGPLPPLATTSNAVTRPVIAAIRAERSILSAQTSVCGQSTILLRLPQ